MIWGLTKSDAVNILLKEILETAAGKGDNIYE